MKDRLVNDLIKNRFCPVMRSWILTHMLELL